MVSFLVQRDPRYIFLALILDCPAVISVILVNNLATYLDMISNDTSVVDVVTINILVGEGQSSTILQDVTNGSPIILRFSLREYVTSLQEKSDLNFTCVAWDFDQR